METSHSLRLCNRFIASIRLPEANINKNLIEFLHPEIPLFLGICRQPVPTETNKQTKGQDASPNSIPPYAFARKKKKNLNKPVK